MISLGNIALNNEDSINTMRKKILQGLKLLHEDAIIASRIASITSQMGRSLCHTCSESLLNIGLFRGTGGVAFCLVFMADESSLKLALRETPYLRTFFDQIQTLPPYKNWHRLQCLVWLGYASLPSDEIIQKARNIIQEKSRTELMLDLQENNQKLSLLKEQLSILNSQLTQENLRMGADLDLLKQMQQLILPKPDELQSIKDLDIAGFMEPAEKMGGDYYDVLYTNGVVTIAIGDVTGHGLESGILMVMTQMAVRTLKEINEDDPVRFLDILNQAIYDNIQRMESEKNLTLAILNYADHKVSISGQHEEIIVFRHGGKIERIDTIDLGFPIGLHDEITDFINHHLVELNTGDGIVLYTDGITEAQNMNKKQYGIEKLCDTISSCWERSAEDMKQIIIKDVYRHIGEQKIFDDITLLVLKQN